MTSQIYRIKYRAAAGFRAGAPHAYASRVTHTINGADATAALHDIVMLLATDAGSGASTATALLVYRPELPWAPAMPVVQGPARDSVQSALESLLLYLVARERTENLWQAFELAQPGQP